MKQEISLLVVFLLVFLYDTFMPKKAQNSVAGITTIFFALFTACSLGQMFCSDSNVDTVAFAGMYVTGPVIMAIKNILNIGMLIVLIQSIKWANSEFITVRRGEFYELILVTLFG
ncbi:MAG: NADH-quinone oxidoreductase subunit N, partial [Muribaculaceae bacterium]|nr:NADH-quinone oxidoreductase subunit N [Muribaculaceae bacterium]